jgi:Membrane proteins related to metalloendopeptidases
LIYKRIIAAALFAALAVTAVFSYVAGKKQAVAVSASYIKYVDFNVTEQALSDALALDIEYHTQAWAPGFSVSLAYLGAKWGGDFKSYKKSALTTLYDKLKGGATLDDLTSGMKYFQYYVKAYGAVLDGMVGYYTVLSTNADGTTSSEERYGLKAYSPIATGYSYNHYDDFGASRSYGYKREHLGHDIMANIGTPIIAVESGYVEACGWNIYGGWRIGIRSFDGKRYYYYAHMRKNHPYNDIYAGKIVTAGEVIGYVGMTGYSSRENVNNISVPHLHIGLQLIFDTTQKDGYNQIWIDMYQLTKFLSKNRSKVYYDKEAKEYYSTQIIFDPAIND